MNIPDKCSILHVFPTFFPAVDFGGPIVSTKMIIDGISQISDMQVTVLTTDAKKPKSRSRLTKKDIGIKEDWPYRVIYCRKFGRNQFSPQLLFRLPAFIRVSNIIHLTACYSTDTLITMIIARLFDRPLIWSPRGAILAREQWAGASNRLLKIAFERLCAFLAPRSMIIHVTSDSELKCMVSNFRNFKCIQISNGVDVPKVINKSPKGNDQDFMICALGRIDPKKGIDILLKALSRLPERFRLRIYGDGNVNYKEELLSLADKIGVLHRTEFCGFVSGDDKEKAFSESDLFVLPSHSENYGIVIGEALAHGLPVVTTDRTPWRVIHNLGFGWIVSPSAQEVADAILTASESDLIRKGEEARHWMRRAHSKDTVVHSFVRLYRSIARV